MQHETKMENQSWLKKLARRLGPGHVVNLCFIVVLLFSTLLTWREVVVLEDAYISSQRNHLENVANALDKHLQYNVDKLIFLRNGMREALVAPLDFTSLRNAVTGSNSIATITPGKSNSTDDAPCQSMAFRMH